MQQVWEKVTEMKNGFIYLSVLLHHIMWNSRRQKKKKVQEFVALFAKNSGRVTITRKKKGRKKNRISEEKSEMYNDPNPENTLSMNSRISIQEVKKH